MRTQLYADSSLFGFSQDNSSYILDTDYRQDTMPLLRTIKIEPSKPELVREVQCPQCHSGVLKPCYVSTTQYMFMCKQNKGASLATQIDVSTTTSCKLASNTNDLLLRNDEKLILPINSVETRQENFDRQASQGLIFPGESPPGFSLWDIQLHRQQSSSQFIDLEGSVDNSISHVHDPEAATQINHAPFSSHILDDSYLQCEQKKRFGLLQDQMMTKERCNATELAQVASFSSHLPLQKIGRHPFYEAPKVKSPFNVNLLNSDAHPISCLIQIPPEKCHFPLDAIQQGHPSADFVFTIDPETIDDDGKITPIQKDLQRLKKSIDGLSQRNKVENIDSLNTAVQQIKDEEEFFRKEYASQQHNEQQWSLGFRKCGYQAPMKRFKRSSHGMLSTSSGKSVHNSDSFVA